MNITFRAPAPSSHKISWKTLFETRSTGVFVASGAGVPVLVGVAVAIVTGAVSLSDEVKVELDEVL